MVEGFMGGGLTSLTRDPPLAPPQSRHPRKKSNKRVIIIIKRRGAESIPTVVVEVVAAAKKALNIPLPEPHPLLRTNEAADMRNHCI